MNLDKNITLIVINGHPEAGKDTFVKMFAEAAGEDNVFNVSTIDYVKSIAIKCGWDGSKTPENRKFLSDLKDVLSQWGDVPYKQVMTSINYWLAARDVRTSYYPAFYYSEADQVTKMPGFIFVHCREPEEIKKFVERNNAITVFIKRPGHNQEIYSNHADENAEKYFYDYVIDNNGTLETLRELAKNFYDLLIQKNFYSLFKFIYDERKLLKGSKKNETDAGTN